MDVNLCQHERLHTPSESPIKVDSSCAFLLNPHYNSGNDTNIQKEKRGKVKNDVERETLLTRWL